MNLTLEITCTLFVLFNFLLLLLKLLVKFTLPLLLLLLGTLTHCILVGLMQVPALVTKPTASTLVEQAHSLARMASGFLMRIATVFFHAAELGPKFAFHYAASCATATFSHFP